MRKILAFVLVMFVFLPVQSKSQIAVPATPDAGRRIVSLISQEPTSDQRSTATLIETMIDAGSLRIVARQPDPFAQDRFHERYQQVYQGLVVVGGDVSVQRRNSQIVSAFGTVYPEISIAVRPERSANEVATLARERGFAAVETTTAPLSIFPTVEGTMVLAYTIRSEGSSFAYVRRPPVFSSGSV